MPQYFTTTQSTIALRAGYETAAPSEFSVGDFNGDGKLDLAISYFLAPAENRAVPIRILAGDGAGHFSDMTAIAFPNGAPTTVFGRENVVGDFNRDGRADIFFAGHGYDAPPFPGEHDALVLSSGATGLADASSSLPNLNNNFAHSAAAADIDGDGDLDIFVGDGGDPRPYFLINDGTGHFTLDRSGLPDFVAAPLNAASQTFDTETFLDVDHDGDVDLFLGTSGAGATPNRLLLNDGHGHFTAAPVDPAFPVTSLPFTGSLAIDSASFDINGDGWADLIVNYALNSAAGNAPGYVQILINQHDDTFVDETAARLPSPIATGAFIDRLGVVDFNGDGFLDLIASNHTSTPIFLNDGYGHFVPMPAGFVAANDFSTQYPGDFNGDGRMDLAGSTGTFNGAEHYQVSISVDAGVAQTGDDSANGMLGDGDSETFNAMGGNDVVFTGQGDDTVSAGAGDDTVVAGSGRGYLRGDEGNDSIIGGGGFDDINGNMGNDTVHGGAGDDYSVGGKDNDLLFGDEGDDIVWGNLGNDTCDGGDGADQVRGGQGDDSVSGGAGNDYVSGDRGNDTEAGGAGADIFHSFSGAGIDRVLDFHVSEGDRVMLDPGTSYTVSQVGADTVIDLGNGDQVILFGVQLSTLPQGWIFLG